MDAVHVGIDVSRDRLDVHVLPQGESFALARSAAGLDDLIARLSPLGAVRIALEATGGFETVAAASLARAGLPVVVSSALESSVGLSAGLALAAALVTVGHDRGLAVGQKNTPQLGASGREATGFDFVVAEECVVYRECSAYTKAYGDQVIDVEYEDDIGRPWASVCADEDRPAMTILRDRELVAPTDEGYVFEHC